MSHYKTLGVSKTASPEAIKAAYRAAVMEHHPDRGGSHAIFHKIQKAYDVLGDAEKKEAYDAAESKRPVESLRTSMEAIVEDFFARCKALL